MTNPLHQIPLDAEILSRTPPEVIELILSLLERIRVLEARVEELEAKLNQNSFNSNKPPSSDPPFVKRPEVAKKSKKPRKRRGMRQQCLRPRSLLNCSQTNVLAAAEQLSGFGPRMSAMIAELAAIHGDSRRAVQDFVFSVIGIPISQGAIQKILDRVSLAITRHYEAIGEVVQAAPANNIDETSWKRQKKLEWLWLMCNSTAAFFFMLHSSRCKAAFQTLIIDWQGILISDGYLVYQKWTHGRQTCLAHLLREAKDLAERPSHALSRPGVWALKELRLLCRMAKHPPSVGQWNMFYARLIRLIGLYWERQDEVGKLVRRIEREMNCLWLFLQEHGVTPTNNHAERTLRFAMLWRKRSFGTRVEKGDRFVERILSLRQTAACEVKEHSASFMRPCRHSCRANNLTLHGFIKRRPLPRERLPHCYVHASFIGAIRIKCLEIFLKSFTGNFEMASTHVSLTLEFTFMPIQKTLLIAGHSHITSFGISVKNELNVPRLIEKTHEQCSFFCLSGEWPRTQVYWDALLRHASGKVILLLWKGNAHLSTFLIAPQRLFDVVPSIAPNLAVDDSLDIIPEQALLALFYKKEQIKLLNNLLHQLKSCASRVILCSTPPPKEDDSFIREYISKEPALSRQCAESNVELNAVELSPPLLRAKLWLVLQVLLKQTANNHKIPYLEVPEDCLTEDGFLPREMYRNDVTHANELYGKKILKKLSMYF